MASGYRTNNSPETHQAELNASGVEYVQYELANEYPGPTSACEQGLREQVSPQMPVNHGGDAEENMQ